MAESSYLIKIPIFKKFYKFVVSKGGADIRGIRDKLMARLAQWTGTWSPLLVRRTV